jgi:hypothetical protein
LDALGRSVIYDDFSRLVKILAPLRVGCEAKNRGPSLGKKKAATRTRLGIFP